MGNGATRPMTRLKIDNRVARRLWLWTNLLADTPSGPFDLMTTIRKLGFVQIDTIRNVTRAHHHILWSRNTNYREKLLWPLLPRDRALFEHFTHDASLLPMEFYPMWQRQFKRLGDKVARHEWYQSGLAKSAIHEIRNRIEAEGALSTHAFDTKIEGKREMWARPPHKKALDQMWYAGELGTCHRENFVKFYDLGSRIFPKADAPDDDQQIHWLGHEALERLSFATPGEIQRFWGATDAKETRYWVDRQNALVPVEIQTAEGGTYEALATPDIEERLQASSTVTQRLRILNPFDPAIRDRNRLQRLFGFEYRNEMFVPEDQRRWGYYVYPLLESDRFVGRMEIKANRNTGLMEITKFWPEAGVKWTPARSDKLDAELRRFARLAGLSEIVWNCPHP